MPIIHVARDRTTQTSVQYIMVVVDGINDVLKMKIVHTHFKSSIYTSVCDQ